MRKVIIEIEFETEGTTQENVADKYLVADNLGKCINEFKWRVLPQFAVSERSELLFSFRDYWKKSNHQNIDEAIKGFLLTKKGKQ